MGALICRKSLTSQTPSAALAFRGPVSDHFIGPQVHKGTFVNAVVPEETRAESTVIQSVFEQYLNTTRQPYEFAAMTGGSDYLPFIEDGNIPSGCDPRRPRFLVATCADRLAVLVILVPGMRRMDTAAWRRVRARSSRLGSATRLAGLPTPNWIRAITNTATTLATSRRTPSASYVAHARAPTCASAGVVPVPTPRSTEHAWRGRGRGRSGGTRQCSETASYVLQFLTYQTGLREFLQGSPLVDQ